MFGRDLLFNPAGSRRPFFCNDKDWFIKAVIILQLDFTGHSFLWTNELKMWKFYSVRQRGLLAQSLGCRLSAANIPLLWHFLGEKNVEKKVTCGVISNRKKNPKKTKEGDVYCSFVWLTKLFFFLKVTLIQQKDLGIVMMNSNMPAIITFLPGLQSILLPSFPK